MRRFYMESLFGLVVIFFVSMMTYELVVYEWATDYDMVFEEREAEALHDMVSSIEKFQGKDAALEMVQNYARKTEMLLATFAPESLPANAGAYFSQPQGKPLIYIDDEQPVVWFHFSDPTVIYRLSPDPDSPLHKAINFDDSIGLAFLFAGFAAHSLFVVWFLSRRVRNLEKTAMAFAAGDLNARASLDGSQRLGTLNQTFNLMADKIARLVTSSKALTNAVAHELRTPVFRIQWQAEMLAETQLTSLQSAKIASIVEDTEEMEQMVDELLYFARVDHSGFKITPQTQDINAWIQYQLPRWQQDSNQAVSAELLPEPVSISFDPYLMKRSLNNLMGNAAKFAASKIQIRLQVNTSSLHIEVHDDGEGIGEEHWPYIFDAFYSANPARDKRQTGFGLGLAIVRQIMLRHQAR